MNLTTQQPLNCQRESNLAPRSLPCQALPGFICLETGNTTFFMVRMRLKIIINISDDSVAIRRGKNISCYFDCFERNSNTLALRY